MVKQGINIGCGNQIFKSTKDIQWMNLDCVALDGVDCILDLEQFPYSLKSDFFDYIYCHQTLEHLSDKVKVMNELYRISKNGAIIDIHVPYFSNCGAFCHAEHQSFFGYNTFDYWCNSSNEMCPDAHFRMISRKIEFSGTPRFPMQILNAIITPLINISKFTALFYQRFFCWILPCENLIVKLEVKK